MNFDNHHLSSLQTALDLQTSATKPVIFGVQIRAPETEKENRIFKNAADYKSQIMKLSGSVDCDAEYLKEKKTGHFGLAVQRSKNEDEVMKNERLLGNSGAVILLEPGIGEQFESFDIGSSGKGNRVQLLDLPEEEKQTKRFTADDIGDQVRVKLIDINVQRGFIDYQKVLDQNNNKNFRME